jgi:hypothetical protein
MTDGTQTSLGVGGDLIADEDLTGQPRLSPLVPQLGTTNAGYKIERTKIAVGDYSQDRGDASAEGAGIPVEDNRVRRMLELDQLRQLDEAQLLRTRRHAEREPMMLSFGRSGREAGSGR